MVGRFGEIQRVSRLSTQRGEHPLMYREGLGHRWPGATNGAKNETRQLMAVIRSQGEDQQL
jgi:hypothetical protein